MIFESFVGSLIAITLIVLALSVCYWAGWKDGKKSERKECINWLNKAYGKSDTDWLPKKEKIKKEIRAI